VLSGDIKKLEMSESIRTLDDVGAEKAKKSFKKRRHATNLGPITMEC